MDQPYSHITPGLTLRSDNVPGVFPAHLGNPASPSRQLLSRVTSPGTLTKLLQQLERQNRGGGGFYNPTAGIAAVYLVLLRHPPTRKGLLLFFGASPADFRSDEHLARALAVAWMFYSLLKMRDAEVNERFDQFAHGSAHRVKIDSVQALAHLINNFAPSQAYALGRLKEGVPDGAKVVRKDEINGAMDPSVIARTKDYLVFNKGEAGLVILDVDFKGMPEDAKRPMEECGGPWGALCEVLPALKNVAYVERASTSSGLRNRETGEPFPEHGGRHFVIPVLDAADIPRFLSDFHDRLRLAGFGWGMVSAAGSFLERSLVDRFCGSPERLIFEAAPILDPSLVQEDRNAVAHDGAILDTGLCAPLTGAEKAELQKLKAAEEHRLLPERQRARSEWSLKHIERLIARGIPESEARAQVERWIDHRELTDTFELPFDKRDLAGATVADVLADPDRFINETMADPHEGPAYGRGKAILYRRRNGSLFIKSFAHGGINYELKAAPAANDDAELGALVTLAAARLWARSKGGGEGARRHSGRSPRRRRPRQAGRARARCRRRREARTGHLVSRA